MLMLMLMLMQLQPERSGHIRARGERALAGGPTNTNALVVGCGCTYRSLRPWFPRHSHGIPTHHKGSLTLGAFSGSTNMRLMLNKEPIFAAGWLDQSWWPDGQYVLCLVF